MPSATERRRGKKTIARLPERSVSLWTETSPGPTFTPLAGDLEVDVAVVGGGITGLTTAALLKQAGRRVAVLEARRVAQGVSGHTTAHLTEMLDCSLSTLLSRFGDDGARLAVASVRDAIDRIAGFVRDRRLECGFRGVPGFLYTERREGVAAIEEEHEAAVQLGLKSSLVTETPLPFPVLAALRLEGQAQIHPLQYLLPLAEGVDGNGSQVFEDTRVLGVEEGDRCRVATERGQVTARSVVLATHAPLNAVRLQTKIAQYRSYAIAVRLEGPTPEGLFWDDEDPYHYVRSQPAPGGELLIVGGEDHKVGQEEETAACYERLLDYTRQRFQVRAVEYRWSAQVAEPVDGLPYAGRDAGSERVFVATGYSGTGLTFGTMAALLMSDLILGRDCPWRELYDPGRLKPVASARDFLAENADFPLHLVLDRLRSVPDVVSLGRGEGRLVELDGRKVAAFRNEAGELVALSPVCTHMGCLVSWNAAERSWDCPCHGSRFDTGGKVLDGPATSPLAGIDTRE